MMLLSVLLAASPALTTFTLDDGLEVVVVEPETVDVCAVRLVVRAGADKDPPKKRGLAHLVEHSVLGGKAGLEALTSRRSVINATTTARGTVFELDTKPSSCAEELRTTLKLVTNPKLRAGWVTVEKDIINREATYTADRRAMVDAALFGNSRESIIGTATTRDGLTYADVRRFYDAHYRSDRMALVVVGLAADAVRAALSDAYGVLPSTPRPLDETTAGPMRGGELRVTGAPGRVALVADLTAEGLQACRAVAGSLRLRVLRERPALPLYVDCDFLNGRLLLMLQSTLPPGQSDAFAVVRGSWSTLKALSPADLALVSKHLEREAAALTPEQLAARLSRLAVSTSGQAFFEAVPQVWGPTDVPASLELVRPRLAPEVSAFIRGE